MTVATVPQPLGCRLAAGAVNGYVLNRRWAFGARDSKFLANRLWTFADRN